MGVWQWEGDVIVKAVVFAYLGAGLAGLLTSVFGYFADLSPQVIVSIAANLGVFGGLAGLGYAILRQRSAKR